jgi:hypothetical protein
VGKSKYLIGFAAALWQLSSNPKACWRLNISVHKAEKLILEAMVLFVEASQGIRFESKNREQVYGGLERVLVEQEYALQGKAARGWCDVTSRR